MSLIVALTTIVPNMQHQALCMSLLILILILIESSPSVSLYSSQRPIRLLSLSRTMGVEPPFIYDPPSRYSFVGPNEKGFNPKAVSQASLSPPRSRPKQDGPLINAKEFNRHPDSYFVVLVLGFHLLPKELHRVLI